MPHDVTMPQLGMAQDAGKIVSWLKAPGDKVAKGDALFEVETDKATMEVEAQASGYLTNVTAAEGEDVPVGQAIARISESADEPGDATAPSPTANASEDSLPEGRQITMPQLGMAQDSGVLVGWQVELGAKVSADDTLFEVETDKATMDVPAGVSGYLAATLAQPGEDVPMGQAVAVISAEKPDAPVARSVAAAPAPKPAPEDPTTAPDLTPAKPAAKAPGVAAPAGGRILASPKLRRMAAEKGLDLALLVQAGQPQPFHMRDLAMLEDLAAKTPATQPGTVAQSALRLEADCPQDGFAGFAEFAAESQGLRDSDALLAGLAGASLGRAATVGVARHGATRSYDVPAARHLAGITETDNPPDLLLRDMRATLIRTVAMGAEDVPVLTLMQQGDSLRLVLECSPAQLPPQDAITLLSEFAGRMHDPLRHLL